MTKFLRLKIGTRGSQLALFQANQVKEYIEEKIDGVQVELCILSTRGDRLVDKPLPAVGGKGFFTAELEEGLLNGEIDLAVHSLKDLPTEMPEGLKIGAITERVDSRDVLVSQNGLKLTDLNAGHCIATSSLRRKAALLHHNPTLQIIDIRGNVGTRISKMKAGYCDAMVMAAAGLLRLNLEENISDYIPRDIVMPAPGQGALALEIASGNTVLEEILQTIHHKPTYQEVEAERSFLHALEGGCQLPIGCYAHIGEGMLCLTGFVASPDGKHYYSDQIKGSISMPASIGRQLADKLLERGADKIINFFRHRAADGGED